ncbi:MULTISPECIES: FAD-dependent oxidoreductase [unclassified Mesorhizobium]|uniref:NAD(P)/FAD-dependent oxidoreductase n=1 Tax=unclassified Mesorhizobium TaxID=325217 RepID=UPI001092A595|nr:MULTISPECIES: FAD-dependent oxidoreductase [unclassified Mesorhizobium]TGV14571.1 FAD-binding oxidoreductase [Mesorhizobium sp. M8A.F.Ca.ET.173.01.1.1]TIT67172.1 MAG: FAD-binding oxidoreductase [Mesorhizobium sp.]TGQ82271.1 FAD-binding oxidoreductase [Mesorhizobium sp. M8A.F.Ca.ET.207.01.1.1]TGT91074.1 FAD-binding oxidoreductase [Mesorhizobium sp. M8A.F.Ca.ET.161.01.1.1]TGV43646.1 FAD-binding oxidoreductase [Mesorhizobium sp. M8A.F.Ca.ET.142.01.1.1]
MPRKLDLRTGRPVWSAYRAPTVPTDSLTRDVKTDVLIIGMGISGAMMAEALTADGHSVICIDRRGPLKGSTAATTALVQFEIDQPLSILSRMIGKAEARQAWRRSRLAVSNLAARVTELGITCGMSRTQSLYLAGTVLGPSELREEAEARRQAGIAATYLTPRPLAEAFGIDRDGAILSHGNIALDPRKLTAGLLLEALGRKARLYTPVEATAIKDSADEVVVATRDGPTITARHVVLATGYELVDIVPAAAHQIISTWAIATRPQPRKLWPGATFIWEASDPYLYVRATTDGRVVCGGEDEDFVDETQRDELIPDKSERIAEKLGRLLPHLDTRPEFAWTGSFGTTTTGLPCIGAIPRHPRIHAVMGYGGNGITFSRIAAEIVPASIRGLEDTDASLFAFNR